MSSSDWKIPLYKIYTDDKDLELITKIIKRGTRWAIGPEIEEFEKGIKDYVGADYCATLNSGTSALHALYLAYGFGQNDEIIVPSFTFISTVNSVLFVNAKPIFADIEEETFGLDPQSIRSKISNRTKAIVPVDYGGVSCKIFEINDIAREKNIPVIEDGAEALGSALNGKKVGTNSESTIFSFCGNKVLTTGEGGAVVTNSKELYEKVIAIRSHGRIDKVNYFDNPEQSQYFGLGYNWRMSSITAALGISQLQKLDKLIQMRRNNAKYISEHLKKYPQIKTPSPPDGYHHIYQMYTIMLNDSKTRDSLHNHLLKNRIFSKVYFDPVHKTDFYTQKVKGVSLPITESVSERVLTLPLYPNMTNEEKEFLVESIEEYFEAENS